jgi:hypothetical protein
MAKQTIPQLTLPPMTAHEKRMWKEYFEAQKAASPETALKTWAHKYDVKLVGKNRVEHKITYRGEKAPPPKTGQESKKTKTGQLEMQAKCDGICFVKSYDRYTKVPGVWGTRTHCDLSDCFYDKKRKYWVCVYDCWTATTYA